MDPSELLEAVVRLVRLALKAGIPGEIIRAVVDDEEKALPTPQAVSEADRVFDTIVAQRFPTPTEPPPEDK